MSPLSARTSLCLGNISKPPKPNPDAISRNLSCISPAVTDFETNRKT